MISRRWVLESWLSSSASLYMHDLLSALLCYCMTVLCCFADAWQSLAQFMKYLNYIINVIIYDIYIYHVIISNKFLHFAMKKIIIELLLNLLFKTNIYIYVCVYVRVWVHMHVHARVCMCMCVRACVCVHAHACMHVLLLGRCRYDSIAHCVFPTVTCNGLCSHLRKIISRRPWPSQKNRDMHMEVFFVDSVYSKIIDIIRNFNFFLLLNRSPMCKSGHPDNGAILQVAF